MTETESVLLIFPGMCIMYVITSTFKFITDLGFLSFCLHALYAYLGPDVHFKTLQHFV